MRRSGRRSAGARLAVWLTRRLPRSFRVRFGTAVEAGIERADEEGERPARLAWDAFVTFLRAWRDELGGDRAGRGDRVVAGGGASRDARYAVRSLLRSPLHAVVTVLTLGLAIGANAAVFSVAYAVLVRTLPYDAPGRTVRVDPPPVRITSAGFSVSETLTGLAQVEAASAYTTGGSASLVGGESAQPVRVTHVDGRFFDVLGVRPRLGRAVRPGGEGLPEAVLSHRVWQLAFGGDTDVLGRTIRLSDHAVTVVGVAAAEVEYPAGTDIWLSYPVLFDLMGAASGGDVIARLTRPEILAEVRELHESRVREEWSSFGEELPDERRPRLTLLRESLVGPAGDSLILLFGAAALVLVLGCVNLAGLTLARNASRRSEFIMRRALGAGRGSLVRLILLESLTIAVAAGALAVGFALAGHGLLVGLLPPGLPGLGGGPPSAETIGFVAVLVLFTSLLIGLLPALQVWFDPPSLPGAAGRLHDRRRRVHPFLVVAEVALAVVLVVAASLLGRSVLSLRYVPLGFDTDHVYAFDVRLPYADNWDEAAFLTFAQDLRSRLLAQPGVVATGIASRLPLSDAMGVGFGVWPADTDESQRTSAAVHQVSSDYFDVLGIGFQEGGPFADDGSARSTVVVSRGLVDATFGNGSVIGRQVRIRFSAREEPTLHTIVGVVDDVRSDGFLSEPRPAIYFPFHLEPVPWMAFAFRTTRDPVDPGSRIRSVVRGVDPTIAPFDIRSLRDAAAEDIASRDAVALVTGMFGIAALALALLGIYGLIAQSVVRRRREMGVRLAVGARGGDLLRLVLRSTVGLAAAGIVVGLIASFGATRLLAGFLFGVGATDPATFAAVAVLVLLAAAAAGLGPAVRAARTDPITSLRTE
jgi:putative ABC transport system permease protein